jgi:hypothetical protein
LRIKTLWSARPQYGVSMRSWDIYTAVLDHNVRDTDEFGTVPGPDPGPSADEE